MHHNLLSSGCCVVFILHVKDLLLTVAILFADSNFNDVFMLFTKFC